MCLAENKLICYTHHLERTASGLAADQEGGRIYYHQVLALTGLEEAPQQSCPFYKDT